MFSQPHATFARKAPLEVYVSMIAASEEQTNAVLHILKSRDLVTLAGGPAGSGKTTLMQEAVKAVATLGYLGQEDREIGFRTFFREKAPEFKVLEPLVCRDDPGIASSNKNR